MPKNIKIYITILILVLITGGSIFYFTRNNNSNNSKTEENKSNQSNTTLISQIPATKRTVEQKQAYCQNILDKSGFLDLVPDRDPSKPLTWRFNKEVDDYLVECATLIGRTTGFPADFTFSVVTGTSKDGELAVFSAVYPKLQSDKSDSRCFTPSDINSLPGCSFIQIKDDKFINSSLYAKDITIDKTKAITQKNLDNYLNY